MDKRCFCDEPFDSRVRGTIKKKFTIETIKVS